MIYSFSGTTVPSSLLKLIREGEVGGVIFFSSNIPSVSQLAAETKALVTAQQESPVHLPLLLMTDQEGGEVRRIADGNPTESQLTIGQSSNPASAAATAGSGAAQTLSGAGLNVNLAPVLDVYATPGNFIDQFQRSYGAHASKVAGCAKAFITAHQHAGVAATAKHFPGLGAAGRSQNTDTGAVTLPVPLSQLRDRDEVPYTAAIGAGVKLVMVSWAVYPALDHARPAGLSAAVVQGELRGRLGYRGVTITDALEAGALAAFGGSGPRAVLAAEAGMDLLLCSARDPGQGAAVTSALASALEAGKLAAAPFSSAVQRVTALRNSVR